MSLEWLLLPLVLGLIYWWDTSAAKDRARSAAKYQCEQQDLQLLDDTVALKKTRLKRDQQRPYIAVTAIYVRIQQRWRAKNPRRIAFIR